MKIRSEKGCAETWGDWCLERRRADRETGPHRCVEKSPDHRMHTCACGWLIMYGLGGKR